MSLSVNKTEHINKSYHRLFVVFIAIIVFACFLLTLNNGFVWDDEINYTKNFNFRGLSASHLHWMFTTFHDDNYHPLVWLTSGLDFFFWGMNPAGYHLTNLVFHALNGVLFYFLILAFLRQTADASDGLLGMQIGGLVGALFFAVHPLRVEPVAWVSARGDLLCGFFYLLTIIAYVRMNEKRTAIERRRWFWLALLFFLLSLLSRAWGITLPLVLLILDVYPLKRFDFTDRRTTSSGKILIEKIPFALFALGAAVPALLAKKAAMLKITDHGLMDRLMQAVYGLCFYIWKTVIPIRLSPSYVLDKSIGFLAPKFILCAILVLGITTGLILLRRRWPWAITAWACYAVVVSPQLGFVQSGPQIAADRYTYISSMPFAVLAGAGVHKLWVVWQRESLFPLRWVSAMALVTSGLLVLSVMSYRQTRVWYDNLTFWTYVLKLNPKDVMAYNNRAVFLKEHTGDLVGALADYNAAIKLDPKNTGFYYNRGILHEKQGDMDSAITDYSSVIRLNPGHAQAYNNRGVLRNSRGDLAGAIQDFNVAIGLAPLSPEAYANRGMIHLSKNDLQSAFDDFTKTLEVASAAWPHRAVVEQLHRSIRKRLN
jgi:hypothetical protein